MSLSRRDFLKLSGAAAGSLALARLGVVPSHPRAAAAAGTTLEQTIVRGALVRRGRHGSYHRLAAGPGEPHILRGELGGRSGAPVVGALAFVHFTDTHIIDAQSPAKAEYVDRYDHFDCEPLPLDAAFHPQDTLTTHVLEMMIRRVREVTRGPATGRRFRFVISTGDNIDNQQFNELRWFIDLMDGGTTVTPNSGGRRYEGVQLQEWGDAEYWHPDPGTDHYKEHFGFPDYPGLLEDALKPFRATGLDFPWWQTYGNHDGLVLGNFPREFGAAIAVGSLKVVGLPPGANPCDPFLAGPSGPAREVTRDPARRIFKRDEYVRQHFNTSGRPAGHGFTGRNLRDATAYYVRDDHPPFRFIALDTVNPGGYAEGSIGAKQLAWLERRLAEVSSTYYDADGELVTTRNPDRLVVLFSHHGLDRMLTPFVEPWPLQPRMNDTPRYLGPQVEDLVMRFPNVIAWVNGHTHANKVVPRRDRARPLSGFWDVNTAAHLDWTCQSRVVEIAVRRDGNISIYCTMLDHAAPLDPRGIRGVRRLAAISRELTANDYQNGFDGPGPGMPEDRNVHLTLPGPPWLKSLARHRSETARV